MKPQDKIGKYLALEEQEKVATGAIWRVAELDGPKISRHLLVDLLADQLEADSGFSDHFMNQSLAVSKLEHPNILRKILGHHENNQLASIYEFHEGFTLERVLRRCRTDMYPFSLDHGLLVASKLLSALAYAKTKHMTHGFLNPSQVFVTHEGEIKLKGFALSSSLRACKNGQPNLELECASYTPAGSSPVSNNQDLLDIFAVGAILYEMLVGESFHKGSGDAATVLTNAKTDADGESIPPKIAKILISSLDPNRPDSYKDIQKMAKDMDDLLFSGEYSPTTFNLAFFMHSAFREEMDGLGNRLKQELEQNYAARPAVSSPPPARQAAPPKRAVVAPQGEKTVATPMGAGARVATPKATQSKSKLPMILGGLVAIAVIVVGLVLFLPKDQPKNAGGFEKEKEALKAEGRVAAEEETKRKLVELEKMNASLLEERRRDQEAKKLEDLRAMKDQIARDNEELSRLKQAMEQADTQKAKEKEIADLTARLEKQKQDEADKLAELRQSQAKALADAIAAADEANPEEAGDSAATTAATNVGNETSAPEKTGPEADPVDAAPAKPENEPEPVEAAPTPELPPEEGDLVALEDEMLDMPVIIEGHVPLDAPRRAVRDGKVKKGGITSFIMKVLVSEKGRVEDVELYRNPLGSGNEDYGMSAKAEKAARKIRYTPPMKLGVKVKVWAYVPIHFRGK